MIREPLKDRNFVFVFAQNLPNFPYFAPDKKPCVPDDAGGKSLPWQGG
jgi:hypothetical protein